MPQTNNSSKRESPEQCPVCDSSSLSYQAEIESWLCDGCSYVLDSDTVSTASETAEETTADTEQVDWESEIAVSDTAEANLIEALSRTEAVANAVGLSDERILRAGEVIAKAWQTNFMHGRSQERTIGATIYAVSREADEALPPAMIAEEMAINKSEIKQSFQTLNKELELGIGPPIPREFVAGICAELELPAKIEPTAKHLLQQQDPAGGNPIGIAAAAVYVTCEQSGVDVTLKEIAQVIGLTKETIWRQKSVFTDNESA